jgi:hypothetical protein
LYFELTQKPAPLAKEKQNADTSNRKTFMFQRAVIQRCCISPMSKGVLVTNGYKDTVWTKEG